MIHDYPDMTLPVIWHTVTQELPPLLPLLRKILERALTRNASEMPHRELTMGFETQGLRGSIPSPMPGHVWLGCGCGHELNLRLPPGSASSERPRCKQFPNTSLRLCVLWTDLLLPSETSFVAATSFSSWG